MATTKQQAAASTAEFKVLSNLNHDNVPYAPGETVELTEAKALALGPQVVEPIAKAEAK